MLYDINDDRGETLVRIFSDGIPEMLKEASVPSNKEVQALDPDKVALRYVENGRVIQKLACLDRPTTAISAIYIVDHGADWDPEFRKMAAANVIDRMLVHRLQVPDELIKMAEGGNPSVEAVEKPELPPPADVEVAGEEENLKAGKKYFSGPVESAYRTVLPIEDPKQIKEAFLTLLTSKESLDPCTLHGNCVTLAKQAEAHGMALPEELDKYASVTLSPKFQENLATRLFFLDEDQRGELGVISELAKVASPEVVMNVIHDFDIQAGLSPAWNKGIPDPALTVFEKCSATEVEDHLKMENEWTDSTGTKRVTESDLNTLVSEGNMAVLDEVFGPKFMSRLSGNPWGVFSSLPEPGKESIYHIIHKAS